MSRRKLVDEDIEQLDNVKLDKMFGLAAARGDGYATREDLKMAARRDKPKVWVRVIEDDGSHWYTRVDREVLKGARAHIWAHDA